PLAIRVLIDSDFWDRATGFAEDYEQAATMLQPVGGMDRIAAAFKKRVGHMIHFGAAVTQIRRAGEIGARLVYKDRQGKEKSIDASFALVTIPLSVLKDIENDFSQEHKTAIIGGAEGYNPAAKIAFRARRRFWEDDGIYGGISWTTQDITQIWYPSFD